MLLLLVFMVESRAVFTDMSVCRREFSMVSATMSRSSMLLIAEVR